MKVKKDLRLFGVHSPDLFDHIQNTHNLRKYLLLFA